MLSFLKYQKSVKIWGYTLTPYLTVDNLTMTVQAIPLHPGQYLAEFFLATLGTPLSQVAHALGVAESVVSALVEGERTVDLDLAMRLERAVGLTTSEWLAMQVAYDLAHQPALTLEQPALESFYWGKPVACFVQSIPHEMTESRCLVTCSFAANGRLVFSLSQNDSDGTPSLTGGVGDHAVTALSTLVNGDGGITVLNKAGFEFFAERLRIARDDAFRSSAFHLEALSLLARIDWYEHYLVTPQSGECCVPVYFCENHPTLGTWCRGEHLMAALPERVRYVARQKLRPATK